MALKKLRKLSAAPAIRKPLKAKPSGDFAVNPKHKVRKGGTFDRVGTEKEKQALNVSKPWNVMVPQGGELTIYTLDEGEPFACYQHTNYGGSQSQRGRDLPCIQDTDEVCPLCQSTGKTGSFCMFLTAIIPVETYTKRGDTRPTTRRYQKKLLKITIKMADVWRRIYETHGTFRGLVLKLNRDGKLDPASGNQVTFVRKISEAKIKQYASGSDVNDKEARDFIIKAEIDKPFDYEKLFPPIGAADLAKLAGVGTSTAGLRTLGAEDDDDDDDAGSEWGAA